MKLSNGGTSALLLCLLTAPVVAIQLVFPEYRYESFVDLSPEVNAAATQLGYDITSWNLPGSLLALEEKSYYSLTTAQKGLVEDIGFPTESDEESETWDCYVNHYYDYDWNERQAASASWAVLGFNSTTWASVGTTAITLKWWEDLSAAEQDAANDICYFEQTWNEEPPIPDWPDNITKPEPFIATNPPTVTNPPTAAPTPVPIDFEEAEYPLYRYTAFSDLTDAVKTAASQLGYDSTKWNLPDSSVVGGIEASAYFFLSPAQKGFVQEIGFPTETYSGYEDVYSETWDCYVNHFEDYQWDEREDATASWAALGYDSVTFYTDFLNATENPGGLKFWESLNEAEKDAAENLCYIEQTWDMEPPIPDWPDDIKGTAAPSTAAPTTAAPTAAPTIAVPSTATPTAAPTTATPTTAAPTAAPTTAAPTTIAPTAAPTTAAPTAAPTTAAPTAAPTTGAPSTSSAPSTSAAPTSAPTTAAPTSAPTTAAPTTGAPTTRAPTTATPTTGVPTNDPTRAPVVIEDITSAAPSNGSDGGGTTTSGAFTIASSTSAKLLSFFAVVAMRMIFV